MRSRLRSTPKHLAAKLLAIRHRLEMSQSQLAELLDVDKDTRVSEYETGVREPALFILLRYAKVAGVSLAVLVNDAVELKFCRNWTPPNKYELRDGGLTPNEESLSG